MATTITHDYLKSFPFDLYLLDIHEDTGGYHLKLERIDSKVC